MCIRSNSVRISNFKLTNCITYNVPLTCSTNAYWKPMLSRVRFCQVAVHLYVRLGCLYFVDGRWLRISRPLLKLASRDFASTEWARILKVFRFSVYFDHQTVAKSSMWNKACAANLHLNCSLSNHDVMVKKARFVLLKHINKLFRSYETTNEIFFQ